MKRTLILMLMVLMIFSSTGHAATIDPIRFEGGVAYVSGTGDKNAQLSVTAVKKGVTAPTVSDIGLVWELISDENGKYSFSFVINDLPDGTDMTDWYTLSVSDSSTAYQDFYFATEKGVASFIDALSEAKKDKSKSEFAEVFKSTDDKTLECLGIVFSDYAELEDAVIDTMYENCTAEISKDEIYNDYCRALGFVLLNQGDETGLDKYNPSFDGKKFSEITDTLSSEFIKKLMVSEKPYDSYDELEESYRTAYALDEINNASSSKLAEKLGKYEDALELSGNTYYDSYKRASGAAGSAMSKYIVEALYKDEAESADELLDVIGAAVKANKSPSIPGGGNSGGSGGGGTGGSGGGGGYSVSKEPSQSVESDVSGAEAVTGFRDLGNVLWAEDAISYLYERGIVGGTGYGMFEPEREVKREEFIKMLILSLRAYNRDAACDFADADKNEWYYPYVASAYESGIVKGYEDNTFGVGNSLTREEAATMLARCAESLQTIREYDGFADESQISDWAKDGIIALYEAGVINGADGSFMPQNRITRAEAAQMLYGYLTGGV